MKILIFVYAVMWVVLMIGAALVVAHFLVKWW